MSATDTPLPLRSLLFAPGNEPRKVQKVATFASDAIILDLEDAVPDADKVATRPLVRAVLADLAAAGPLVCVRVNGLATGLTAGDVEGVVARGLDAVVLPKTEAPEDLHAVDAMLAAPPLTERAEPVTTRESPVVRLLREVERRPSISYVRVEKDGDLVVWRRAS
jgi:citrate lyase subunit beta/citryl-CoA lyase